MPKNLTEGDNVFTGENADEEITGFGGNDIIIGNALKNQISGGEGDDWLENGNDNEQLCCGNDVLIFSEARPFDAWRALNVSLY